MKKKILYSVLIILLVVAISTTVFADEITSSMQPGWTANNGQITKMGQEILGIVQAVGLSVAVIMMVVLAIRFMLASAEGKAEVKKQIMPYLIGAILLFAASSLLQIPFIIGEAINKMG